MEEKIGITHDFNERFLALENEVKNFTKETIFKNERNNNNKLKS